METTTTIAAIPAAIPVDTYVRVKNLGTSAYDNKIGKVVDALVTSDSRMWVKFLNQEYDTGLREFLVPITHIEPLDDQENAPNMQLLEAWESRYHSQRQIIQRRDADHEALCDTVIAVMNELGYCEEGDRAIDEINNSLANQGRSIQLRRREREYEVQVNIRTTVWASTRVTVTATSEDDAIQMVEDDPDCYLDSAEIVCDEVTSGSCDFEYECEIY